MEFFAEWGLFLAKTLTIVVGIVITIGAILVIRQRMIPPDGNLIVTNLNTQFDEIANILKEETLSKAARKALLKERKKQAKTDYKKEKAQVKENTYQIPPRLFVVRFDGDIRASDVNSLRESVSAIISVAEAKDEVLVILESAGGYVHSYGLAASQMQRIRDKNIPLTVAIDKCAASGGYLMACVANQILAAPFAIVGSIGVIAQIPNFHKLLEKNNIDFELHTAGHYKRTLTMFGENTEQGRQKFIEDLNSTHELFQSFVKTHRPQLDISKIATGEHWHAEQALHLGLVDKLQTSDDYLLAKHPDMKIFEIEFEFKQNIAEKFGLQLSKLVSNLFKQLSLRGL